MSFRSSIRTVEVQGVVQTAGGSTAPTAPTLRTSSKESQYRDTNTPSTTFAIPASTKAGDMLILSITALYGFAGGNSASTVAGWTKLSENSYADGGGSSLYSAVFSKVAVANEPAVNVTWTSNVSTITSIMTPVDACTSVVLQDASAWSLGPSTVNMSNGNMFGAGLAMLIAANPAAGASAGSSWATFGWAARPTGAADWTDADFMGSPGNYSGLQKIGTCPVSWGTGGAFGPSITSSPASSRHRGVLLWLKK